MDKKKKRVLGAVAGILLLAVSCLVSYRIGRGPGEDGGETAEEGEAFFSGDSTVLALSEGGVRCDYSVSPAPYALVGLADRLVEEIEKEEGVFAASFYMRKEGSQVFYGMEGLSGGVYGAGPDFLEASGLKIQKGRGITDEDVASGAFSAVINDRAAARLFGSSEPLGKVIEIEGKLFQVVGVAGAKDAGREELVLVPESVWPELYQYEEPKAVAVRGGEDAEKEAERAERILNSMIPEGIAARYEIQ